MLQKDFARSIGMQPSHLSSLIHGTRSITPAIAAKLEKGLGISATFWINLQNNYNLDVKRIKERDKASGKKSFDMQSPRKPYPVNQYPVRALADPAVSGYSGSLGSAASALPRYENIMLTVDGDQQLKPYHKPYT